MKFYESKKPSNFNQEYERRRFTAWDSKRRIRQTKIFSKGNKLVCVCPSWNKVINLVRKCVLAAKIILEDYLD